ncbi:MAG: cytochrome c3 family protein, partial [Thermoanaerobaculia bacterium]
DGGLVTPASTAYVDALKKIPLFAGTMQCASCHNVHDPLNVPFLNISNAASALCTTCHIK